MFITSITAQWPDLPTNDGYVMKLIPDQGYTSLAASSATTNADAVTLTFNAGSLASNTTYWIKVGALYNGSTSYAFTTPVATSTLTDFITNTQVYRVFVTSIAVNWTPLGSAQGYRLEAYSDATYTTLAGSSVTASVALSTLTVEGLQAHTTYWLKVGGINHNSVITYTIVGASQTSAGAAPVPTITGVFVSSISVQWPDATLNDGYVMEAYSDSGYTSLTTSSATVVADLTSLTFNAGTLLPNTTYWIKVGALYNGATSYGFTTPVSTSTLTSLVTNAQVYRVFTTSVAVNWTPLGSAQGYRLEAYSDASFITLAGSSVTADVALSTLTVEGLLAHTTYWFRVGGINHNSVANYIGFGSSRTSAGAAPVPTITQVFISSMTAQWLDVADNTGYVLEAYSDSGYTSLDGVQQHRQRQCDHPDLYRGHVGREHNLLAQGRCAVQRRHQLRFHHAGLDLDADAVPDRSAHLPD